MTGKELVKTAMTGGKTERVPWVPFCGVHAGHLLGVTATEFLKDADLITKGLAEAVKRYRPDGIPVVFDLQIEAEILGCDLNWSDDNPPAVISHPLAEGKVELADLKVPTAEDGRMPIALEATRSVRAAHPDLAVYGLITGPFTLALHLLGTDIFMGMFDKPDYVNEVMDFCAEVGKAMSDIYIQAGCDVIAVVDPMTSQIGPDQFREFCSRPVTAVFEHIRGKGALGSFFVCGHAQNNIEAMCECRCDGLSIDENIPLDYVRDICREKNVSFGGNMKLTTVMLLGSPEDNQVEAVRCMDIGGDAGFILAPGCDMPFAVPPENVEAIAEVVHDEYKRQVARELADADAETAELMDMSDYGQLDKVVVDIITLDSEACAPCQYMVESVRQVAPEFGDLVEWREHKIKHPESIALMSSLYVRNIPTICIDGQIKFVSQIPPREKLIEAIRERIVEKMELKVKRGRGRILLLGSGDEGGYSEMETNIESALRELGAGIDFEKVSDPDEIRSFGVFSTPAVVTQKHSVKSAGRAVEKNIVKEWIKALND